MTDGPAFSNRRMILKWVELRGPLSAVWKTAIAFPNQPNSKSTIPNQTNQFQPNQPPAGTGPAEEGRRGRGLGQSPILKKYPTFLLTPARHTRRKPRWETHFPTSHGGGTGDSILHCRSSSILARRMRSANSVSLADFAICSKASQLNPGRRTAPPSLSDFSFS